MWKSSCRNLIYHGRFYNFIKGSAGFALAHIAFCEPARHLSSWFALQKDYINWQPANSSSGKSSLVCECPVFPSHGSGSLTPSVLIYRSLTLATQFNQSGITIPVFLFVWWFPEAPGNDGLNKQRGTMSTTCGLCLSSACCCYPVRSCLAASTDHRDQATVRDAFFHCPCIAVIFTPVGQTFLRCKSKTPVAICCLHGGVLNIFTAQAIYCRAFVNLPKMTCILPNLLLVCECSSGSRTGKERAKLPENGGILNMCIILQT